MSQGVTKTCEGCAGAITGDQILHRQAGLVGGKLLCPDCVARKREELLEARHAADRGKHGETGAASSSAGTTAASRHSNESHDVGASRGGIYLPPVKEGEHDVTDEKLELVSDEEVVASGSSKIVSFADASSLGGAHRETGFKRPLSGPDEPATRCRTFHGKLTQAGLAHMDDAINEWLDNHPEVFIKSSIATVGIFEGKTKEPHLLVTVFY